MRTKLLILLEKLQF